MRFSRASDNSACRVLAQDAGVNVHRVGKFSFDYICGTGSWVRVLRRIVGVLASQDLGGAYALEYVGQSSKAPRRFLSN